ncbi:hypothetical protein HAZT_HAZT000404 [Hyalella azteca]|uniref:PID domain-containing protein n=1 Tax=Hyalella azteca TaxID=294128 RepID=A0A6A0HF59_HYAAZ|nr:hypothetical protein HAZT_HAZT000404 [Hyalella azteca]
MVQCVAPQASGGAGRRVLVVVSLAGVKICDAHGKRVLMAHALRRISYATCDPQRQCFSFLARAPRDDPATQSCHSFLTATPQQVSPATHSSPPSHNRSVLPLIPHRHATTGQ